MAKKRKKPNYGKKVYQVWVTWGDYDLYYQVRALNAQEAKLKVLHHRIKKLRLGNARVIPKSEILLRPRQTGPIGV